MAKYNFDYGKIAENPNVTGGSLYYAPKTLWINGLHFSKPTREQYLSQGWKFLVWADLPEDYEEVDDYVLTWNESTTEIYLYYQHENLIPVNGGVINSASI